MKPTFEFNNELLDNSSKFKDPFFDRFKLRHAPAPIKLTDTISKNYFFPTFYANVSCAIGIFLCDWNKARAQMPHSNILPVKMPGGRALVVFSCYEYKDVMGVVPYNEIAMTIPVMANPRLNVPVLPMIASSLFPSFGYYVFGMPVTSKENQIRGNTIWGLPKETEEIDIHPEGQEIVTIVKDAQGQSYFELRVPKMGTATEFDVSANLYSKLDGKMLKSQTSFKGNFQVNKMMDRLWKKGGTPSKEFLKIGKSPSAKILNDLEIDPNPFQFRYTPSMNSAFDLPFPDFKM